MPKDEKLLHIDNSDAVENQEDSEESLESFEVEDDESSNDPKDAESQEASDDSEDSEEIETLKESEDHEDLEELDESEEAKDSEGSEEPKDLEGSEEPKESDDSEESSESENLAESRTHRRLLPKVVIFILALLLIIAGALSYMRLEAAPVINVIRNVSQGDDPTIIYENLDEKMNIAVEGVLSYFSPVYGKTDGSSLAITDMDVQFVWLLGDRGMLVIKTNREYISPEGQSFISPEHVTIKLAFIDGNWLPVNIEGEL